MRKCSAENKFETRASIIDAISCNSKPKIIKHCSKNLLIKYIWFDSVTSILCSTFHTCLNTKHTCETPVQNPIQLGIQTNEFNSMNEVSRANTHSRVHTQEIPIITMDKPANVPCSSNRKGILLVG